MKVELNEQELGNVYLALVQLAKSAQVDANGMKILLMLSEKFITNEGEVITDGKAKNK